MQVILMERVRKLGITGDVVKVKKGFARHHLLPKKIALVATQENLKIFQEKKTVLEAQDLEHKKEAHKVAKKIKGINLFLVRQASSNGRLYGSVNTKDLVKALGENNVAVTSGQIEMTHPIKDLGVHSVRVILHSHVFVDIIVSVALTEEEARKQVEQEKKYKSDMT